MFMRFTNSGSLVFRTPVQTPKTTHGIAGALHYGRVETCREIVLSDFPPCHVLHLDHTEQRQPWTIDGGLLKVHPTV